MSYSSTSSGASVSPRPEDRVGQVLANRIRLTSVLGVGAYGVVYSGLDILTGTPYAIKALPTTGLDARQKRFQHREITLHYRASRHDNIVSLVELLEAPDCMFVVMEYCGEGDLFANITERRRYVGNDALAKRVFLQLVDAVEHCHGLGIFHRDLKPENVLVCDNGYKVKLADFGLATTERYTSDFGCGSTFYMSPECQQNSTRSSAVYDSIANDVWSLGVILVNLTCGRNPWKRAHFSDSTFRAFCEKPGFLRTILPLSPELEQILRGVFELNPKKRISLQEFKRRIQMCPRFTVVGSAPADVPSPTPSEISDISVESYAPAPVPQLVIPQKNFQQMLTPPPSPPAESPSPFFYPAEEEYVRVEYTDAVASSPVIVNASPDYLNQPRVQQAPGWQFPITGWQVPASWERLRSNWRNAHVPFALAPGIKAC